jgi:hypothetical protein
MCRVSELPCPRDAAILQSSQQDHLVLSIPPPNQKARLRRSSGGTCSYAPTNTACGTNNACAGAGVCSECKADSSCGATCAACGAGTPTRERSPVSASQFPPHPALPLISVRFRRLASRLQLPQHRLCWKHWETTRSTNTQCQERTRCFVGSMTAANLHPMAFHRTRPRIPRSTCRTSCLRKPVRLLGTPLPCRCTHWV